MAASSSASSPRYVDIGANLCDPQFQGSYRGKQKHDPDLDDVLARGWSQGMEAIMITAGTLDEGREAADLAVKDERIFSTVGVHPTRATEVAKQGLSMLKSSAVTDGASKSAVDASPDGDDATREAEAAYWVAMVDFLRSKGTALRGSTLTKVKQSSLRPVVAVGETGLDYARLEFSDKTSQMRVFLAQIDIACEAGLPMFLHNRETGGDFLAVMKEHAPRIIEQAGGAVVHSFDGSAEEAAALVEMGLYIGINGCSLKTEDNVKVAAGIPLDRLMLETDCPWCGIRRTHAGHKHIATHFEVVKKPDRLKKGEGKGVKDRCEPAHIVQVAEVLAGARGCSVQDVAEASRRNAIELFLPWLRDWEAEEAEGGGKHVTAAAAAAGGGGGSDISDGMATAGGASGDGIGVADGSAADGK